MKREKLSISKRTIVRLNAVRQMQGAAIYPPTWTSDSVLCMPPTSTQFN